MDVRLPSEFARSRLRDATNVPLISIREKTKTLDRSKHYVLCCDSGRRSSAGAYILAERGFNSTILTFKAVRLLGIIVIYLAQSTMCRVYDVSRVMRPPGRPVD